MKRKWTRKRGQFARLRQRQAAQRQRWREGEKLLGITMMDAIAGGHLWTCAGRGGGKRFLLDLMALQAGFDQGEYTPPRNQRKRLLKPNAALRFTQHAQLRYLKDGRSIFGMRVKRRTDGKPELKPIDTGELKKSWCTATADSDRDVVRFTFHVNSDEVLAELAQLETAYQEDLSQIEFPADPNRWLYGRWFE